MSERATAPVRADFPVFRSVTTRWMDNDAYGHVNNVVYYSYIDTVVTEYLLETGAIDYHGGPVIGLAVESGCNYFAPISFPDRVAGGIRVERLGSSSVRYGVGIFRGDDELAAAAGFFTHVYVDAQTRRPVALPERLRSVVEGLVV